MTCIEFTETVSAYLDNEVTQDERTAMEQHVASCAACAKQLESYRVLKHSLARLEGRASPPPAVQARIMALRFQVPQRRRYLRWLSLAAVVTIALAAVMLTRAGLFQRSHPSLSDELIADHLRYVPEAMPAEVASQDPLVVSRFFEDQISFEPVVPSLMGARLIGGRVCKIEGRKAQLLFYRIGDNKLSLYVMDQPAEIANCRSSGEYHLCGHQRGSLSLVLVGDVPEGRLRYLLDNASL